MKGWIVRPQRRFHDGIKVISLEYGLTPTVIATVNDELAEAPVHASVIAAAPEMLEALKTLHSNFADGLTRDSIAALIAKAEGRTE
jgi:hypothetical protein